MEISSFSNRNCELAERTPRIIDTNPTYLVENAPQFEDSPSVSSPSKILRLENQESTAVPCSKEEPTYQTPLMRLSHHICNLLGTD